MKAYISIHDVSPDNLNDIENIISILSLKFNIKKISILVIPGLNWSQSQIHKIKTWQNNGIQIAAHGWFHKTTKIIAQLYNFLNVRIFIKCQNMNDIVIIMN